MRSSWATERASSLWNRLSDQTGKRGPHSAAQAVGPKNVQNRENTAMRGCVNFPKTLSYILSLQFRTNSLNLIPQSLRSHMVNALPRRDWKQLKGCVFSPPSLFPVQSRPLVRSAFCPKKIDHTSGLTLHPFMPCKSFGLFGGDFSYPT